MILTISLRWGRSLCLPNRCHWACISLCFWSHWTTYALISRAKISTKKQSEERFLDVMLRLNLHMGRIYKICWQLPLMILKNNSSLLIVLASKLLNGGLEILETMQITLLFSPSWSFKVKIMVFMHFWFLFVIKIIIYCPMLRLEILDPNMDIILKIMVMFYSRNTE